MLTRGTFVVAMIIAIGFALQTGSAGGQTQVLCNGEVATIVGTEERDVLLGTDGPDVIAGLGGNDVIRGLGGDDIICGDNGRDRLFGGKGSDVILGGKKNDIVKGDGQADVLYGNQGNDRIIGGAGADILDGGSGLRDRLIGKGASDTCIDPQNTFTTSHDTCEVLEMPIGYTVTGRLTDPSQDPVGPWTGVVVTVSDDTGEVAITTTDECESPTGDPCEQGGRYTLTFVAPVAGKSYNVNAGFGQDVCITPITLSGTRPSAEVEFTYPPCG